MICAENPRYLAAAAREKWSGVATTCLESSLSFVPNKLPLSLLPLSLFLSLFPSPSLFLYLSLSQDSYGECDAFESFGFRVWGLCAARERDSLEGVAG